MERLFRPRRSYEQRFRVEHRSHGSASHRVVAHSALALRVWILAARVDASAVRRRGHRERVRCRQCRWNGAHRPAVAARRLERCLWRGARGVRSTAAGSATERGGATRGSPRRPTRVRSGALARLATASRGCRLSFPCSRRQTPIRRRARLSACRLAGIHASPGFRFESVPASRSFVPPAWLRQI